MARYRATTRGLTTTRGIQIVMQLDAGQFGIPLMPLTEIGNQVSKYAKSDLVRILTRLCCLISLNPNDIQIQQWAVNQLLSPVIRNQLDGIGNDATKAMFLSRKLLIAAIQFAYLFGGSDSSTRSLQIDEDRHAFGVLLLQISSLMGLSEASGENQDIEFIQQVNPIRNPNRIMATMLRASLDGHQPLHWIEILRGFKILSDFLPQAYKAQGKCFPSLIAQVSAKVGCDIQDLWFVAMAIFLSNAEMSIDDFGIRQPGLNRLEFFDNFKWTEERISATLGPLVFDSALHANGISDIDLRSTKCFRAKPILRIDEDYLLADPIALIHFIGDGIFDLIADNLAHENRRDFKECFGIAFQEYCRWLAIRTCASRLTDSEIVEPAKGNATDIQIRDNKVISLIEIKTDPIRHEEIESRDTHQYANAILRSEGITKGAKSQLPRCAMDVLLSPEPPNRLHIVLLEWNDAFSFFCIQQTFNDELCKQLNDNGFFSEPAGKHFRRGVVLGKHEWESICLAVAEGRSFVDCFDAIVSYDELGERPARFSLEAKGYLAIGNVSIFLKGQTDEIREYARQHMNDRKAYNVAL